MYRDVLFFFSHTAVRDVNFYVGGNNRSTLEEQRRRTVTAADRAWTRRIDFLARTAAQRARPAIMGFRHMLMICMIVLFGFFSAASADLWAQWCVFSRARTRGFRRRAPRRRIVAAIFVGIMLLVDLMFLNESARARRRRVPTPGGPARPTPGTRAGIHLRPGPGQLAPARREKRLAAKLPALPPPPDFFAPRCNFFPPPALFGKSR